MRGVLAVVWSAIIFIVIVALVNLCVFFAFPQGGTQVLIGRLAGLLIAAGLAFNAYKRNSKPPTA